MESTRSHHVTRLLGEISAGREGASEELFDIVYEELRALAGSFFRQRSPNETLQPTALVHEAYLRLTSGAVGKIADRNHFFALAARVMRQVLVDHARRRGGKKRGGAWNRISFHEFLMPSDELSIDMLALDEALRKLAEHSERKARLVELRFFGGLSSEEAAELLDISRTSAAREWRFARAWLIQQLEG